MEGEIRVDPIQFLRALHEGEVPYLLVGRQALVLLGAPVMTADYDFYLSPEREDLESLLRIAKAMRLEPSVKSPAKAPFFSLLSDDLKLDFFRSRRYSTADGETFTFAEVYSKKKIIRVQDFAVQIPSLGDLIRMKRVRNSPRDLEDINYLQVLLDRQGS